MAEIKLTPEQQQVTECYGDQLLVSAAAGSGKTRVLVERLLKRVCEGDEKVDVDDYLIITFTNAAASELRGKILDAIYERIALDPENKRLRYEADVCNRAQISTIHSFCSTVIRENAHTIGLNPNFRVADELEAGSLKTEVLNNLIEEAYSSENPRFFALADTMGAGRDDSKLVSVILDTYDTLMSHPYPEKWVDDQISLLNGDYTDLSQTIWGKVILNKLKVWVNYRLDRLCESMQQAQNIEPFMKKYGPTLDDAYNWAINVKNGAERGWDEARKALNIPFMRAGTITGYEDLKKPRNDLKAESVKFIKLFSESSEKSIADIRDVSPLIEELLKFVLEFSERYSKSKRDKGIIDFNDQEHLALRILIDPNTMKPTAVAEKLSHRYAEIMVDEYQDVNAVQELIFSAVSHGDNLFMVGDVKQSIYRFRLADPTIFLHKYHSFENASDAKAGEGRKIILQRNFRSRAGILNAVNFVFKNIMSEELGDIDYSDSESLYAGAKYPDTDEPEVELDIIEEEEDGDNEDDSDENPDKIRMEASYGAQRILELMGSGKISDGSNELRSPEFRDFAILLRSKSRVQVWVEELNARNIPVSMESETDFFETPEISIAMSLLTVIDNPHQDIPLLGVLRSPIYGVTSDELGEIRSRSKDTDLYTAVIESSEANTKCAAFLNDLDYFRYLAPDLATDEFIWRVFNKLGYFACVSAMPGGEKRRENLITFIDCAKRFESQGYRGLFSFVRFMEKLSEKGQAPVSHEGKTDENAVTIMSIHKSKGLEFPIVILADTSHQFNTEDSKKQLLIHKELGVGPKKVDLERRIEYPTVARKAIAIASNHESLSEEMRVLYVAMTRAREKLVMLASFKNAEKIIEKYADIELPAPPMILESCKSFAEWIICAAIHRPEAKPIAFGHTSLPVTDGDNWDIRLIHESDIVIPDPEESFYNTERVSEEDVIALSEKLNWKYQYKDSETIPSKITATELKGTSLITETHEDASELEKRHVKLSPPVRPEFTGKHGLTAAQKGTAAHLLLQYCDYSKCLTCKGVQSEIERLREIKNLTDEQADAIDPHTILRFFTSNIGKELMKAENVWRELKFSTMIPAKLIYGKGEDEILLQGVIDCMFEKDGALTIIDFKTDSVTSNNISDRAEMYRGQLDAYSYAMKRIMGRDIRQRVLFFLKTGTEMII